MTDLIMKIMSTTRRPIGQQNLIDLIMKIDNVKGKKRMNHRKRETYGWKR